MDNIEKQLNELKEVHMDNQFVAPEEARRLDMVDEPPHYTVFPEKEVEARDIIEQVLKLSGVTGSDAYNLGCALKYLLRAGRKGEIKEDIAKCQNYCQRLLS